MDEKWFKAQQKKVGATAENIARQMGRDRSIVSRILNGRQAMSPEWAKAFAEVLDQPVATILEKAGVVDPSTAQQLQPGFAESDVIPFVGKGMDERGPRSVAEAFGQRSGVDVWRVKGDALALAGYLPGDFVLVDTFAAERVKPGDVVLAQVYDRQGGATTVLRKFQPPVLVCPKDLSVHVVDGNNVVIMGKVTASWRVA